MKRTKFTPGSFVGLYDVTLIYRDKTRKQLIGVHLSDKMIRQLGKEGNCRVEYTAHRVKI